MKTPTQKLMSGALLSGLLLTGLPAQAGGKCAPFILYAPAEGHRATYIDHHKEGSSIGDHRIGSRVLHKENGDKAGTLRFIGIFLEDGELSHLAYKSYFELSDGLIITSGLREPYRSPTDENVLPIDTIESVVIGGTNKYRGIEGSVSWVKEHDKDGVHDKAGTINFDVSCD